MKKIFAIAMILAILLTLTACGNNQPVVTDYTYTRAQIRMLDGGVVHGDVKHWARFSDGIIQVTLMDGRKYLAHANNVILRSD